MVPFTRAFIMEQFLPRSVSNEITSEESVTGVWAHIERFKSHVLVATVVSSKWVRTPSVTEAAFTQERNVLFHIPHLHFLNKILRCHRQTTQSPCVGLPEREMERSVSIRRVPFFELAFETWERVKFVFKETCEWYFARNLILYQMERCLLRLPVILLK